MSLRSPATAAVLATAVLATACGPGTSESIGVSRGDRVAAIQTARTAVAGPLVDLGSSAERVVVDVEAVVTSTAPPEDLLAAVDAVEDEAIAPLVAEIEAVTSLDLTGMRTTGGLYDVRVAQRSLDAAVGAARAIVVAARAELETVARAVRARRDLEAVAARWDERGSFSEQLERLAALAAEASVIAEELEPGDAGPGEQTSCDDRFAALADVARQITAGSRELADLVRTRQGMVFDERREALEAEVSRAMEETAPSATCWREHSSLSALQDHLQRAIADVESVLNPEDLAG